MTEETKKPTKKKELTEEEKILAEVDAQIEKELRAAEVKKLTQQKLRDAQNEKNKILVRKAFDGGIDNAPAIGKAIGMSENGVHRYAKELGIELRITQAEFDREEQELRRKLEEKREKMRFGMTKG